MLLVRRAARSSHSARQSKHAAKRGEIEAVQDSYLLWLPDPPLSSRPISGLAVLAASLPLLLNFQEFPRSRRNSQRAGENKPE